MATKESRHGKIAEGNRRRQLLASEEQWATWDDAAARAGISFSEWARQALDAAAEPPAGSILPRLAAKRLAQLRAGRKP